MQIYFKIYVGIVKNLKLKKGVTTVKRLRNTEVDDTI